MKLKLTFLGPGIAVETTRSETGRPASQITITTKFLKNQPTLADVKPIWEMEQAFNGLTNGRLHISLVEDDVE